MHIHRSCHLLPTQGNDHIPRPKSSPFRRRAGSYPPNVCPQGRDTWVPFHLRSCIGDGCPQLGPTSTAARERNRTIRAQARLGKRTWHTASGYSKRSKVETTFFRYKNIFGPAMRARGLATQRVEATIGCKILNRMTALGMPDSQMIG